MSAIRAMKTLPTLLKSGPNSRGQAGAAGVGCARAAYQSSRMPIGAGQGQGHEHDAEHEERAVQPRRPRRAETRQAVHRRPGPDQEERVGDRPLAGRPAAGRPAAARSRACDAAGASQERGEARGHVGRGQQDARLTSELRQGRMVGEEGHARTRRRPPRTRARRSRPRGRGSARAGRPRRSPSRVSTARTSGSAATRARKSPSVFQASMAWRLHDRGRRPRAASRAAVSSRRSWPEKTRPRPESRLRRMRSALTRHAAHDLRSCGAACGRGPGSCRGRSRARPTSG